MAPYLGSVDNLGKIFNCEDVLHLYPKSFKEPFTLTHTYENTIRPKILNYQSLTKDLIDPTTISCDCKNHPLCDQVYQHVITGNLNIVESNKLRNLMAKGLNYREPVSVNKARALQK